MNQKSLIVKKVGMTTFAKVAISIATGRVHTGEPEVDTPISENQDRYAIITNFLSTFVKKGYQCFIEDYKDKIPEYATLENHDSNIDEKNKSPSNIGINVYWPIIEGISLIVEFGLISWDKKLPSVNKLLKVTAEKITFIEGNISTKRYPLEKSLSQEMHCILMRLTARKIVASSEQGGYRCL